MGQRLRNILLGLMSIMGLVGLAMILAVFGYVPPALQDGYDVKVVMNDTGGLMPDGPSRCWTLEPKVAPYTSETFYIILRCSKSLPGGNPRIRHLFISPTLSNRLSKGKRTTAAAIHCHGAMKTLASAT